MQRTSLLLLLFLPIFSGAARHHEAHVHGEARLEIAREGPSLFVTVNMPGMTAVGFEHAVEDENEQRAIAETTEFFKSGRWLALDPTAGCQLVSANVVADGYAMQPDTIGSAKSEVPARRDDQQPDRKPADQHHHADFDVSLSYSCRSPLTMRSLDVLLFDRYPTLQAIKIAIVSEAGQGSQVLLRGFKTVPFSK